LIEIYTVAEGEPSYRIRKRVLRDKKAQAEISRE